ncbi:hypothetical protein KJ966_14275 [bacterium]|nr:hypothetical protein [bacterium]
MTIRSHQLVKQDVASQGGTGKGSEQPGMEVRFVSLIEKRQIQGIDLITDLLKKQDIGVDHFEYKVIKKSEIRRPINPKLKNSPTERVTVEDRINVNANLKTVGQLEWRVFKDPENILLLQLTRSKGEALCLPLFFDDILQKDHQILITGLTDAIKLQLQSKPDLKFIHVPEAIEKNPDAKEQLISRAARLKGMQATARELIDFPGLPEEISKKIALISSGKKEHLSDAQAINLILLSDLCNRYASAFQTFQNEIVERNTTVAVLARQFEIFTKKISTRFLISKFADFLGENADKCSNNQQIFTYLYQKLQQMEEKQIYVNKKLLDRKDLFKLLRSIVCIARSQFDPDLWKQCFFFLNPDDIQTIPEDNEKVIANLVAKLQGRLVTKETTASKDLMEIFFINNIYDYIVDKKISIAEEVISKPEADSLKSIIAPILHLKVKKSSNKGNPNRLFSEQNQGIQRLINPIHFVASAYGILIGQLLKENLKKFLVQDKKDLLERFGVHFFDILYEQAVFEKGINISRNQFAGWLEETQLLSKSEEFGYRSNTIELDFDKSLTHQILSGSGLTTFPPTFSNDDFEKEYVKHRNQYLMFFNKLKRSQNPQQTAFNATTVFLDYIAKGKYNLRSPSFRKHVSETFLYTELNEMIKEACVEIRSELAEEAVNKKIILQLPLKFCNLLFLGNTFEVPTGKFMVQVRVHAVSVKAMQEDDGIHYTFASNFSRILQESQSEKRTAIIQAMRILGEYQKISLEFIRFLSIVLLDRQLNRVFIRQKLINRDPRFLKFKMPDVDKLTIGSIRDINLNKIFQYNSAVTREENSKLLNQSFGEMIQSVMYYKSVEENLVDRIQIINEIKLMMNRFSKSLKASQEWKTYFSLASHIGDLISLPIASMQEKVIHTVMDMSIKLNRLVTKHEYKSSVIAILHAEWKRKNPEKGKQVYFYLPFLGDEAPAGKTNLLLEIRKARDLIKMLKMKRAIIFFPGATKEIQLNQMIEIKDFIEDKELNPEIYIEIKTLSEDKLRHLSKEFYPTTFFHIDKIEPVKMPIRQQVMMKQA